MVNYFQASTGLLLSPENSLRLSKELEILMLMFCETPKP